MKEEIDFVVMWVDGNDKEWQREKIKYEQKLNNKKGDINISARYRDWDNMKYWFRSVEKFAPWVRKIHFVTYGHVPNFLNLDTPKLNVVRHEDFIPKEYLPLFNSSAIEVNINKIPGLAEKFVLFNDDMFLIKPVLERDFFEKDYPKLEGLGGVITSIGDSSSYYHMLLNNVDVINRHFNKYSQLKRNFLKWYNLKYGLENIRNICLLPWKYYTGFKNSHLPAPHLRSTWDKVWANEYSALDNTRKHKFRDYEDLTQYVFRYWQLASGEFVPQKKLGNFYDTSSKTIDTIVLDIVKQRKKMICINDTDNISDEQFELYKERINRAFNEILNEKSSFEK